jgi:hypothetical protein
MQLAYIFLAEAAETTPGKFFAFGGGLHHLGASAFPSIVPAMAVLADIQLQPDEAQAGHQLRAHGEGPDGAPFFPDIDTTFGPLSLIDGRPDLPIHHLVSINFRGLTLETPGRYSFIVLVDGHELGRASFVCDRSPSEMTGRNAPRERDG